MNMISTEAYAALEAENARLRADMARAEAMRDDLRVAAGAVVDAWANYYEPLPFELDVALTDLDVMLGDMDLELAALTGEKAPDA